MAAPAPPLFSLFTCPLFSSVITLYVLILLYFPSFSFGIIFSPVLISTSVILLSLLRLGAIQKKNKSNDPIPPENSNDTVVFSDDSKRVCSKSKPNDKSVSGSGSFDGRDQGPGQVYGNGSFVEWDVRAPLEVIYEGYEGQGEESDDDGDVSEEDRDARMAATFGRYASLSNFYPETDSDTSEDDDSPGVRGWDPSEKIGFRWDGEDRDGMIEIELERKVGYSEIEEENLIEIDLHPTR